MVRLADLYRATHQFSKAERLLEKAMLILQEALGPEHTRVANASNNLGVLYCDERRLDEAAPLFRRALDIYQNAFGRDHFQVAAVLTNLALVQTEKRAYQEPVGVKHFVSICC